MLLKLYLTNLRSKVQITGSLFTFFTCPFSEWGEGGTEINNNIILMNKENSLLAGEEKVGLDL